MICPHCKREFNDPSGEYADTPEAEDPRPFEPVRVGFSTPKSFNPLSWLVRKFTNSRASHAFFVYRDLDWNMDVVLEAHELGIRLLPLDAFERANVIVKMVTPKNPIEVGLRMVAHSYLGSMYDFAGLVGMAVVMLGRFLKRKWKNPFRGSKSVYCSEAVVLALLASPGYETVPLDPDSSPEDLLTFFEKIEGA